MQRLAIGLFLFGSLGSSAAVAGARAPKGAKPTLLPALTLDEVQAALRTHPEAAWTATDSDAVSAFSGKPNPFGLPPGLRAAPRGIHPEAFATPVNLPPAVDWRSVNGQNWLPPVRDQGRCGSCVAFATVGLIESAYNVAGAVPGFNARFSEQDLFSRIGTCAQGAEPEDALEVVKTVGVPDSVCSPYISGRSGVDVPTSASCADIAQRVVKINDWRAVSAEQAKAALQSGPLLTIMDVYQDFMYYSAGVYKHVTGAYLGGHAIVIVGYDDAAGAWIVRNSWGPKWGETGYFRIAYNDVSGLGTSNYALTVTNNSYVKVGAPADQQAVSGPVSFLALNPRSADLSNVRYTLTGVSTHLVRGGVFDNQGLAAAVNSGDLPDDTYILRATGLAGGNATYPWYELIEVANTPQNIHIALNAAFDTSKVVTGSPAFKVAITQQNVGLTTVELHAVKDGQTLTEVYQSPGGAADLHWHGGSLGAGTYAFTAVGKVGDLQQFTSNTVSVQLAK